jgi:hypothetical protein
MRTAARCNSSMTVIDLISALAGTVIEEKFIPHAQDKKIEMAVHIT